MAAMIYFNCIVVSMSDGICMSPTMLLDPEKVWEAVGISLLAYLQAAL